MKKYHYLYGSLLVAVMLLSLTACGATSDKLVGDWTATVSCRYHRKSNQCSE